MTALISSDQECGEALGSALKGNLSRRLHTKKLVLCKLNARKRFIAKLVKTLNQKLSTLVRVTTVSGNYD